MSINLPLRCSCGTVQGVVSGVSAKVGTRVVCYCDDCQAFAHYLGRPESVLDEHGGTSVFQVSPARMAFNTGAEHLACVDLTGKGVIRWYTNCCRSAVGNTMSSSALPFVGMIQTIVDLEAAGTTAEEAYGPRTANVHLKFARQGALPLDVQAAPVVAILLRFFSKVIGWRLQGAHRKSPFFDPQTGKPIVEPIVLGKDERKKLYP